MKLKRIQIVEATNGRKFLQLCGHGRYSVEDLVSERACNLFRRMLVKRIKKARFYNIRKPMDVVACMVSAYLYGSGRNIEETLDLDYNQAVNALDLLGGAADLEDPLMTYQSEYIGRYGRLFRHLYGAKLTAKGVDVDA